MADYDTPGFSGFDMAAQLADLFRMAGKVDAAELASFLSTIFSAMHHLGFTLTLGVDGEGREIALIVLPLNPDNPNLVDYAYAQPTNCLVVASFGESSADELIEKITRVRESK